jgi:fructose-1,6-bisphosphatase I
MNLEEFLALNAEEDLAKLTTAVSKACVAVWESIPSKSGTLEAVNPSGEKQKAIDVYSNDVFTEALTGTGSAAEVASEEMADPVRGKGRLSVAMDPLDGSSNVETNNPLGSIFGFYDTPLPAHGRSLVGALYVTYGSMVTLTLSFGKGVHRFVMTSDGRGFSFQLHSLDLKVPASPKVYGIGGSRDEWIPPVRTVVDSLAARGMRIRYCGTFVGDYNQVLAKGGVFAYPELVGKPKGKLRVHYETAPMAYINEQAGGYATDGRRNILDIEPTSLAETSPVYIGSPGVAKEFEEAVLGSTGIPRGS